MGAIPSGPRRGGECTFEEQCNLWWVKKNSRGAVNIITTAPMLFFPTATFRFQVGLII